MSTMKHFFVAIPIPFHIKESLETWSKSLRALPFEYKEWVYLEDFHITLKFLGGVDDNLIEDLSNALHQRTRHFNPFVLKGKSFGTFGNPRSPRVLWAGVNDSQALNEQQEIIDEECSLFGYSKENRLYRPHITVAKKWRSGVFDAQSLPALPALFKESWSVDHCVLYQIHPSKKPKYEKVQRFQFGRK